MIDEVQRPTSNLNRSGWTAYWTAQGMAWRTEPEIDEERQRFLAEHRAIRPDIRSGLYPFKDVKLDRADVEWLLATHKPQSLDGPVIWNGEHQRKRRGIDLRGADLRRVDLRNLPLARARMGLGWADVPFGRNDFEPAAAHMEGSDLGSAHLEAADLIGVHLESAYLDKAVLRGATLKAAHLPATVLTLADQPKRDGLAGEINKQCAHPTLALVHSLGGYARQREKLSQAPDAAKADLLELCALLIDAALTRKAKQPEPAGEASDN